MTYREFGIDDALRSKGVLTGGLPFSKRPQIQCRLEMFDSEMALSVLETRNYAGNRPISEAKANEYAESMRRGRWRFTGEPLIFDEHGRLLNGQHRLSGVAKSGAAILFLVVDGVPDSELAYESMDQGKKRTAADSYKGPNANSVMATSRILHMLEMSGRMPPWNVPLKDRLVSNEDKIRYAQSLGEQLTESVSYCRNSQPRSFCSTHGVRPPTLAAIHYLTTKTSPVDANEFFPPLITGANLSDRDPRFALRNRLISMKSSVSTGESISQQVVYCLFVKAWNAFRSGQDVKMLRWRTPEPIPAIK